jgi:hypothetical protein
MLPHRPVISKTFFSIIYLELLFGPNKGIALISFPLFLRYIFMQPFSRGLPFIRLICILPCSILFMLPFSKIEKIRPVEFLIIPFFFLLINISSLMLIYFPAVFPKPARARPFFIFLFCIISFQTSPVRAFSIIKSIGP